MRLKKLILHGFKSFADRTEFEFDAPITGIVGPNGCGKSNILDGFKWVLGEQSAKSLRGEAMMDVIFNGSGGRKPSGMAEVTLVFDNPKREDDTRILNIDADEVAVGRRLFRDGTSEYQLNNTSSRLKDIRELFLDTGVGVDAYSVIEQGRVAALLDANPEERRQIFEEAAGISKFKQRKKEAQRKLEKVDQNLLRVHDIVDEVEKRLRSVKIQAGRARVFQEHSTRLRELRLTYAIQEYHTHHSQLAEIVALQAEARTLLEGLTAQLNDSQSALTQKREQFDRVSQERQNAEYQLVQAKASLQSAQQRQQYAEQQLKQIGEQLAAFEQDRTTAQARRDETATSADAEQETLSKLTSQVAAQRDLIEQRQQAFRDGQLALNQIAKEIESQKTAILDILRRLASVNSRLGAIEIERKNIAAQQDRLGQRRVIVMEELRVLEEKNVELNQKLVEINLHIGEHQQRLESARAEGAALGRQIAQLTDQLGAAREHRSGLLSRQKLLKDLEARREGVSEGVQSVLRQRESKFSFIRGLVADVLRVDVEHAHAIEAALDGRDQMLLSDLQSAALESHEAMAELEGRVNVLCADRMPPFMDGYDWNQHPQPVRRAMDLVRYEQADEQVALHLLGRTMVCGDLASAADLHRVGPAGYRYVTMAGEVIESDGTLRAGPLTESMGLLSRRAELESLDQQIAETDARVQALAAQIGQGTAAVRELEERQNILRNEIYQANTTRVEITSSAAQNVDRQSALKRERPLLDREIAGLGEQIGRLEIEHENLCRQGESWETEQARREQEANDLAARQQQTAESLKTLGENLTSARVELGQSQEKQIASQQTAARLTAAVSELTQQIERIASSITALVERRAGVESELEFARDDQKQLEARQQELHEALSSLAEQVAAAQQELAATSSQVDTLRSQTTEAEQALHQLDMKCSEVRVRLEGLVQRTRDELELDLPARYAELQSADQEGKGYQPAEMDWDAVAAEIKELKEKIHRLGNVNLDAISELDELEKRQQFLSTQFTDLTSSKQQLEELINQINLESSLRFEQTFNAVREHFQGMFRKLFGGGKADLYLETELVDTKAAPIIGEDGQPVSGPVMKKIDVLDAGIEIIARPPGKQPVNISQLSGGEKTMTCVALLLSIFKSKPSPFCILDEVDAALDEANNQRFNLIVQEFLAQSQFIIITHSKRTMQITDVLYGVTMQEQGVSKRVSVKFDQVDNQGRIAEQAAA